MYHIQSWSARIQIRARFLNHGFDLHPGEYSIRLDDGELCQGPIVQIGSPRLGCRLLEFSQFKRCLPFYNHVANSQFPLDGISLQSLDAHCPYGPHPIILEIDDMILAICLHIRADAVAKDSTSWALLNNNELIAHFSSYIIDDAIDGKMIINVNLSDCKRIIQHLLASKDLDIEHLSPKQNVLD